MQNDYNQEYSTYFFVTDSAWRPLVNDNELRNVRSTTKAVILSNSITTTEILMIMIALLQGDTLRLFTSTLYGKTNTKTLTLTLTDTGGAVQS